MRILTIGESGQSVTEHGVDEFRRLGSRVLFGCLYADTSYRRRSVEPGMDTIGPMLVPGISQTVVSATNLAKYTTRATSIGSMENDRNSTLANAALNFASVEDQMAYIQWKGPESVAAVRCRLVRGAYEEAGRLLSSEMPDEGLYDGLRALEVILRLPPAEATGRVALFNSQFGEAAA